MEGWIKLHRSLLDWEWYTNSNTKDVFIHIILKANYEDKKWQGIDVPRGSYITSYKNLAKELKLSVKQIRIALEHLKTTGEVTIKTTNKYTRITIENWEKYQGIDEGDGTQNGTPEGNQRANKGQQLKNNKNIKNIRNNNIRVYEQKFNDNQIINLEDLYEN